ncbi:MAG: class I SAM-dependent methyltransferase [Planctomycetes bacterium]|nr:class I SAM-dependent methyltransferase [Planctomycetota bacterium]
MDDTEPDVRVAEFGGFVEQGLLADAVVGSFVLDWCGPLRGTRALTLGSASAHLATRLLGRGAAHVEHVDLLAATGDARTAGDRPGRLAADAAGRAIRLLARIADASVDIAVGFCPFTELTSDGLAAVLREIARVLRPGGRLLFVEPHPALAFLGRDVRSCMFDTGTHGWFSARDRVVAGRLRLPDGERLAIRYVQKSFGDYLCALRDAGFRETPDTLELGFENARPGTRTTAVAAEGQPPVDDRAERRIDPSNDRPIHLLMRVRRPSEGPRPDA